MVWSESLGVEYLTVIMQFIENGYLEKASVEDKLMANLRIKDQKDIHVLHSVNIQVHRKSHFRLIYFKRDP